MTVIPDRASPSVGYRAWLLDKAGHLQSPRISGSIPCWLPRKPFQATCFQKHEAPSEACSCGVYAKNTLWSARTYFWPARAGLILGEVALWGTLVEHEDGFRAQYAYPTRLFVSKDFSVHKATKLSEAYGVPVEILPQLTKRQRLDGFISSPAAPITGLTGIILLLSSVIALVLDSTLLSAEQLRVSARTTVAITIFVYVATSLAFSTTWGRAACQK